MLEQTLPTKAWQSVGKSALPLETAHLRRVLGYFPTGVAVITARYNGKPIGFTANSFCSVSLEPALVSFCVGNSTSVWPLIEVAGSFCVNILSEEQKDVCALFARKGVDRFLTTDYRLSASGTPIIRDVLAWISCSIVGVVTAGDHVIVLGQVNELHIDSERNPLVFYKGRLGTFDGGA